MNHTTTQAVSVDITPHSGAGEVIPSLPVERIVAQRNRGSVPEPPKFPAQ